MILILFYIFNFEKEFGKMEIRNKEANDYCQKYVQ